MRTTAGQRTQVRRWHVWLRAMSLNSKPWSGLKEGQKLSMWGLKMVVSPPVNPRFSQSVRDSTKAQGPWGLSACSSCSKPCCWQAAY